MKKIPSYVTVAEIARMANTSRRRAVGAIQRLGIEPVGQVIGGGFSASFFPAEDALAIAHRIATHKAPKRKEGL
jgi:hypothetical protein